MSINLPATYTPDPKSIPLGTADWFRFDADTRPAFRSGDLWLSRLPGGEPVGYRDDRHVLLVSGTRTGKGASVIIPNLCLWPGSAVVIDPKGENAMVTARRRGHGSDWAEGMGQRVLILDPFGEVSTQHDDFADLRVSFNPLDVIGKDRKESVDDAARIAESLIVSENTTGDLFFDEAARGLLKAVILHVASSRNVRAHERNLLTVRHILMSGDDEMRRLMELSGEEHIPSGISLLFKAMRDNPAFGGAVANGGAMLEELLDSSPRTLMSVLQVARTNTDFLDSPAVRSCLGQSDFTLADLKTASTTLYLCLPQRAMESHYRWLRMMVTLILGEMERVRPELAPEHPLLMVLDEFPALRRMKVIENAAAQIAGYGVKMMFVAQTFAQLKDVYKDNWETLVANAGVKLFFGNEDNFTREYVSKLIGDMELRRWGRTESRTEGTSRSEANGTNTGRSGGRNYGTSTSFGGGGEHGHYSFGSSSGTTSGWSEGSSHTVTRGTNESTTRGGSETFHKRALVTPDEVGRLFGERERPAMLALISGMQPLPLQRTTYFADRAFLGRFDPHKDHPAPKTRYQRAVEITEARCSRIVALFSTPPEPKPRPRKAVVIEPAPTPKPESWLKQGVREALLTLVTVMVIGGICGAALSDTLAGHLLRKAWWTWVGDGI